MDDVQVNSMVYVKQPCRRIVGEIVIKLLDPKRSEAVHLRAASSWRVKRRKALALGASGGARSERQSADVHDHPSADCRAGRLVNQDHSASYPVPRIGIAEDRLCQPQSDPAYLIQGKPV